MKTRSASKTPRRTRKGATPPTSERPRSAAKTTPRSPSVRPKAKRATPKAKRAAPKAKRAAPKAKRATPKAKRAVAGVKRVVSTVKRAVAKRTGPMSDRERVHGLLDRFSSVMLVTTEGHGQDATLRARPMAVAKLDDDCTLTFMTSVDAPQSDEARKNAVGYVIAQGKSTFLSLNGTLEVVRDRTRVEAAWKPTNRIWFPKGKDDPNLALLVFRPEHAEIWDATGTRGLKYLFEAAKALVTGERAPRGDSDQHDSVDLRPAT